MVLKGKQLDDLIAKYEVEADKNWRNYQDTGLSRYERAQHKAEDLADTLKVARDASEDHNKMLQYRWIITKWAAMLKEDHEKAQTVRKEIIAYARLEGLIGQEP